MERQTTIEDLRRFFNTAQLPPPPFELSQGTKITTDLKKFVDLEFRVIDGASSLVVVRPATDRLYQLYRLLTKPAE